MKKETSTHYLFGQDIATLLFESEFFTTTETTTATNSIDTTNITTMFKVPLQIPVPGLSAEVQKITSIPAVGNQQIILLLNTLIEGQTDMRIDIQNLTADVRGLQTDVQGLQFDVQNVKAGVQSLTDDVGIFNQGFQQLGQHTSNVEEQVGQLNTQMETVSGKVDDCDGGLNRVEGPM
ncbi:hypothetical protein EG328_011195 [Venturia inaequalis]|uniref:Uncharacterized protein n=1 Tax=Venturia inaequalis TaxID=5025 RepID=A0A8H3Z682_VENIN|nr:hypothetical protein EG328_011195 [Venturia inaequalis]